MASNKDSRDHGSSEREAKRILDRIENESETVGTSSLARVAEKTRAHFLGGDPQKNDPIEVMGTRIGRILALIAVVVLVIYLYNTYLMK